MDTEITNKKRVISEKSLANLRPFKPGEVHSTGRPKKADTLISCIKEELEKVSINGKSTNEQLIAGILVKKATMGDAKSIELLMEYTVVKPKTVIGGDSDAPLVFRVIEATPANPAIPQATE